MGDFWRAVTLVEIPYFDFHFTIRYGGSLVLAKMLGPTLDYKIFDVAAGNRGVFVEAPTNGAVAAADAAQGLHGAGEFDAALGVD